MMFLLVSLIIPSLFTAVPLPPDFLCGHYPSSRIQGSQICNLDLATCKYNCREGSNALSVATTTAAPTQRACTDMSVFEHLTCGLNRDGSLGPCLSYDLPMMAVPFLPPPCLVNGRLPRNCRLNSQGNAVVCRTYD